MKKNTSVGSNASTISLTIVAITSIIAIMICCLSALGYNSKVTLEKEKIEVSTTNSNLN